MSDEVADLIDKAADLIDKHGHLKGNYGDSRQGFCATGALKRAEAFSISPSHLQEALVALSREIPFPYVCGCGDPECVQTAFFKIIVWNDHPARTKQEVLDRMRAAAKKERS